MLECGSMKDDTRRGMREKLVEQIRILDSAENAVGRLRWCPSQSGLKREHAALGRFKQHQPPRCDAGQPKGKGRADRPASARDKNALLPKFVEDFRCGLGQARPSQKGAPIDALKA